jgi:hypothetical protein
LDICICTRFFIVNLIHHSLEKSRTEHFLYDAIEFYFSIYYLVSIPFKGTEARDSMCFCLSAVTIFRNPDTLCKVNCIHHILEKLTFFIWCHRIIFLYFSFYSF